MLRLKSVELVVVEWIEVKVKLFWLAAKESRPSQSLRVPARLPNFQHRNHLTCCSSEEPWIGSKLNMGTTFSATRAVGRLFVKAHYDHNLSY